jgi:hypothetical protein
MEVYRIDTRDQRSASKVYEHLLPYGLLGSGDGPEGFIFFLPRVLTFAEKMNVIGRAGIRISGPEAARTA